MFMHWKSIFLLLIIISTTSCDDNNHRQFNGYVEADNIYLSSPFSGILQKMPVRSGQHVNEGELLFSLDPNPQILMINQIQGELGQAQNLLTDLQKSRRPQELSAINAQIQQTDAQIQLAAIRVSRLQKLYAKQATDKDSLDSALANLKQQQELKIQFESNLALAKLGGREDQIKAQQSQIDSLVAKLNQSKWELAQKTALSPRTGVIFDTYYRVGELVAAQQPVMSLLTPENVKIEFFVPIENLANLKVNQQINFSCETCATGNVAFVSYISPEAEYLPPVIYSRENSSKLVFRIKARIQKPALFKPGQPIWVSL